MIDMKSSDTVSEFGAAAAGQVAARLLSPELWRLERQGRAGDLSGAREIALGGPGDKALLRAP
jgi:hypothetical protein